MLTKQGNWLEDTLDHTLQAFIRVPWRVEAIRKRRELTGSERVWQTLLYRRTGGGIRP